MTYIWINPVTERMYDRERLDSFLEENGFTRVYCREDWGAAVRKKYLQLADQVSSETAEAVADVRCPAVRELLKKMDHPGLVVPEIEPILLHCAREIGGRRDLLGSKKVIITPCGALAEAGNHLGLPETEFLPWNRFLKNLGAEFPGKRLESSPVPPGFFGCLKETDAVTGPEAVERYLREKRWRGGKMVEFLYCEGGCHSGDGVTEL